MNRWKIPAWLEREVLARDTACVYCGVAFTSPPQSHGARPSWEHIINDASIITRANIVRCCMTMVIIESVRTLPDRIGDRP